MLALVLQRVDEAQVEEPGEDYGARLESMEAGELLALIRQAKEVLSQKMDSEEPISAPSLVITRDYRIFLGGTRENEIRMRPMSKAIFLLFLKHPEGIEFLRISDYRPELGRLYRRLSRKGTHEEVERSLDRVLDAYSREVNVAASRAAEAFTGRVETDLLPHYIISGERGGIKRIRLDRRLVKWL